MLGVVAALVQDIWDDFERYIPAGGLIILVCLATVFSRCRSKVIYQFFFFSAQSLSYDVAVFQWITSCNKSVMTTRVLTLLREYVTSLTTSVTTMLNFIGNMFTLKAIKSYLRSHMIKRILHSWSFHMKFIKLAEGSFNKTTRVRSSIYHSFSWCSSP